MLLLTLTHDKREFFHTHTHKNLLKEMVLRVQSLILDNANVPVCAVLLNRFFLCQTLKNAYYIFCVLIFLLGLSLKERKGIVGLIVSRGDA